MNKIEKRKKVVDNRTSLKFEQSNGNVDIGSDTREIGCRKCYENGKVYYVLEGYKNVDLLTLEIGLEIPNSNQEGDLHKKFKYENLTEKKGLDIYSNINYFERDLSVSCIGCNEVSVNE